MIIGVGGFLGVGEKNVAVAFPSLKLAEKDGKRYLVLNTTKEALEVRARLYLRPQQERVDAGGQQASAGGQQQPSGKTSPMGSSKTNPALPQ